ncbi:DNA-binding MltR family transcriptional regulator [Rhodopseudomonas rhenobacensis]|uniref:DNA-binding MltR family transcriptional regulator n=2 Tax=Rhodopseudomonas rhenobacensis TaxID=87461 RepID=A0A7W7Z2U4_9BRAD|nr:DNA-binding MltR family transcriptional regulator [Rhodopseudomonas rhenobacensis]
MSDTSDNPTLGAKRFFETFELWTKSHAGTAILSASILDRALRGAILAKMKPGLSKEKQERLFGGLKPLSEFAAKIDVAYALEVIDDDVYVKLMAIKNIRNRMAHEPKEYTFFSGDLFKHFQSFNFTGKAAKLQIFSEMVAYCLERIERGAVSANEQTT